MEELLNFKSMSGFWMQAVNFCACRRRQICDSRQFITVNGQLDPIQMHTDDCSDCVSVAHRLEQVSRMPKGWWAPGMSWMFKPGKVSLSGNFHTKPASLTHQIILINIFSVVIVCVKPFCISQTSLLSVQLTIFGQIKTLFSSKTREAATTSLPAFIGTIIGEKNDHLCMKKQLFY